MLMGHFNCRWRVKQFVILLHWLTPISCCLFSFPTAFKLSVLGPETLLKFSHILKNNHSFLMQQWVVVQTLCVCVYIYTYMSICLCLYKYIDAVILSWLWGRREGGEKKWKAGRPFPSARFPLFSAIRAPLFEVLMKVYIFHLAWMVSHWQCLLHLEAFHREEHPRCALAWKEKAALVVELMLMLLSRFEAKHSVRGGLCSS